MLVVLERLLVSEKDKLEKDKCVLKSKKAKKRKDFLLSDSHGRRMSRLLSGSLGPNFSVTSLFKPNAKLSQVFENVASMTRDFSKNYFLIIAGGTNDIDSESVAQIVDIMENSISNVKATVVLSTIPYREVLFK